MPREIELFGKTAYIDDLVSRVFDKVPQRGTTIIMDNPSSGDFKGIYETIEERLTHFGYEPFEIKLAFEEAYANSFKHGASETNKTRINYEINENYVIITVEDFGGGFDPTQVPDPTSDENLSTPSGRGVMLMVNYADKVTYNQKGTCVKLEFYKSNQS